MKKSYKLIFIVTVVFVLFSVQLTKSVLPDELSISNIYSSENVIENIFYLAIFVVAGLISGAFIKTK